MAHLTTHVLDTARGCPAEGLAVLLFRLDEARTLVTRATTNADGRCDQPLLSGEAMTPGRYELLFEAGPYLRTSGAVPGDPPFLDQIPVRFGIADATRNYHVPLLLSPYGYSTYRGS